MAKLKTTDDFINDARVVHGDRYDYSRVNYVGNKTKVEIVCQKHGSFNQKPKLHLKGNNCQECADEQRRGDLSCFIERAVRRYGFFYDYTNVLLEPGWLNSVVIKCPDHGPFVCRRAKGHLTGQGCPSCGRLRAVEPKKARSLAAFLSRAPEIHGDRYDYTHMRWNGVSTAVEIICPSHGSFWQIPKNHISGSGCVTCGGSACERAIVAWLGSHHVSFVKEKTFDTLVNPASGRKFRYDFYIEDWNCLIEYDGLFHHRKSSRTDIAEIRRRDELKTQFAYSQSIILVRMNRPGRIVPMLEILRRNLGRN